MSQSNYRIVLSYDSDKKTFVARVPELGHCQAEGSTRAEAIARAEDEISAQLANMREHGGQPPQPLDEQNHPNTLQVKVSRSLHRELIWHSHNEGVGVDHLAGELLASAIEARRNARVGARGAHQPPRPPATPEGPDDRGNRIDTRPRGANYGARYHGILEDRANFIEYVRGLDQGQHPGAGGSRRRRRNRGGRGGPGMGPPQGGSQTRGESSGNAAGSGSGGISSGGGGTAGSGSGGSGSGGGGHPRGGSSPAGSSEND